MTVNGKGGSLCLMCRRFGGKCNWSKWFLPVDGWSARITRNDDGTIKRAWVAWCPEFKPDKGLPELFTKTDRLTACSYIYKNYGYITDLRYTALRYHFINEEDKWHR